jgi:hypothetical protein
MGDSVSSKFADASVMSVKIFLSTVSDEFRREPASYASVLQIGVEPIGKHLIFCRVAYEAGVKPDRFAA